MEHEACLLGENSESGIQKAEFRIQKSGAEVGGEAEWESRVGKPG